MGKLVPVLLAAIGIGAGIGAGLMLRPEKTETITNELGPCGDIPEANHEAAEAKDEDDTIDSKEYVKLNNQFVIPVVKDTRVASLVVVALSVEVDAGQKEVIYTQEPKLRDAFLQVFFDHANSGGFEGAFTNASNMKVLRRALQETARDIAGDLISDVLITEIARQDA